MNNPRHRNSIFLIGITFLISTFLFCYITFPSIKTTRLLDEIENSRLGDNNRESRSWLASQLKEQKNGKTVVHFANELDRYFNALLDRNADEVKAFTSAQNQVHFDKLPISPPDIKNIFISSIVKISPTNDHRSSSQNYMVTYATVSGWIPVIKFHSEVWFMQNGNWVATGPESPWLGNFSLLSLARRL